MKLLSFCTLPLLSLSLGAQTVTTLTLDQGSGGGGNPGDVGQYTSHAIINGHPAISYYDKRGGNLKYVRASDAGGTSWSPPVLVDFGNIVGLYTSLAVVDGYPAISYYDQTNGDLRYVRANNANGTSWGVSRTVASTGIVGAYTSLAVVDGRPAISYYDQTNGDLKYVRASNAGGTVWGAPVTLDSTGAVGWHSSLTVVDGYPAVSYHDVTNGDLKYVRASDASGAVWGTPRVVDSAGLLVGLYSSLKVVDGHPAISYQNNVYFDATLQKMIYGSVKYVRATDTTGTNWGSPLSVTNFGGIGTSLAVVDGHPAISYHDAVNGDLKYARAGDANGASWSTPVTLDSTDSVGDFSSLVVINGHPAISYYDKTNGDLKWAIYGPAPDIQVEAPLGIVRASGGLPLNFGTQPVEGGPIIGFTHRVTNAGPEPLTGLTATIIGAAPADFTLSAVPPATLAPGENFQFVVSFDPTEPGVRTATLSLASDDPAEIPFLVPLTGIGLTAQEAWRMQYFLTTENSGNAADDADPDGDGDENLFEFVAGLVPNDPASRFQLGVEPVAVEPAQKAIVFGPVIAGRTYEVRSKASLSDPTWEPLGSFTTSDNGNERTVIDLDAGTGPRFYIVEIVRP